MQMLCVLHQSTYCIKIHVEFTWFCLLFLFFFITFYKTFGISIWYLFLSSLPHIFQFSILAYYTSNSQLFIKVSLNINLPFINDDYYKILPKWDLLGKKVYEN